MRTISMVFFSIAIAFICIGLTANRTFLYVGLAFMVLAVARLVRATKQ
jgi:hypothetical protein